MILVALSPATYLLGLWLLFQLDQRYPALRPFLMTGGTEFRTSGWLVAAMTPIGVAVVLIASLLLEVAILGYDRSALKRLMNPSASARVDLFYVALRLSGGVQLLGFVFSLGTIYYVANAIDRHVDLAVLSSMDSFLVQFGVVYLVNTFFFYVEHRLLHTRWLWELHKVHHAATELNVVTSLRSHPIEFAMRGLANTFPAALLGADPLVTAVYAGVNGVYQAVVHSELRLGGRVLDWIWITPAAHRVHHSNRPEHWNRNYGILTVWDRVFGTYHPPEAGVLTYGVDGDVAFNRNERVRELFAEARRWLAGRG